MKLSSSSLILNTNAIPCDVGTSTTFQANEWNLVPVAWF